MLETAAGFTVTVQVTLVFGVPLAAVRITVVTDLTADVLTCTWTLDWLAGTVTLVEVLIAELLLVRATVWAFATRPVIVMVNVALWPPVSELGLTDTL